MKKFLLAMAASAALLGVPAMAQTEPADPVVQAYRAYDGALGRGDLAAAETAATAALAASEARDGDGGGTARLAANLAQVRLDLGRGADALAPAQRALSIVEARGAQSGVDSIYARLLLGRAELATQGVGGETRLRAVLNEARSTNQQRIEAYDGAIALGEWGLNQGRPEVARDAFQIAADLSNGQSEGEILGRAQAQLGVGISLAILDRPTARVATGSRLAQAPDSGAERALLDAMQLVQPLAERDARRGQVTRAQVTYSSALAWAHARAALMNGLGWESALEPTRGIIVDLDERDGVAACPAEFGAPAGAPGVGAIVARTTSGDGGVITGARYVGGMERLANESFGYATSVVARISTDASGAVTDARVLGSVDNLSLDAALSGALAGARSAPRGGCSRSRVMFAPVVFLVDGAALENPALRTALMVTSTRATAGVGLSPNSR